MRAKIFASLLLAAAMVACSSSNDRDASTPTPRDANLTLDATPVDTGTEPDAGVEPDAGDLDGGARDGGERDGGERDGGDRDGGLAYDDAGCLTYQSASVFCGFNSDETICNFSVGCGTSTDLGQCKINCEMGTTVSCYTPIDVVCVEEAFGASSCTDFAACGWIF